MKTIQKLLNKKGYSNFSINKTKSGYNIYFNPPISLLEKPIIDENQRRVLKDALSFVSSSYIRAYTLNDIKLCISMLPDLITVNK